MPAESKREGKARGRREVVKRAGERDETFRTMWLWPGFAVFFFVSLAIGARLLLLAVRTTQAPELLIGAAVLGIGPLGFGLQVIAQAPEARAFAEPLAAAGAAGLALGVWAMLLVNWLVHRRRSRVALAATLSLALLGAALLLAQPLRGSFLDATRDVTGSAARGALQALALGWGAVEALLLWSRLRKRVRLGLADALVANRFLIWALSAAAAALAAAVSVGAGLVLGRSPLQIQPVLASSSALGLAAAIGAWLAFAPPRAYRAWIVGARARA